MEDDNHRNYIDMSSTEDDEDGIDNDHDGQNHVNGNEEDLEVEEEEEDDEYSSDASTNESVGIYGSSSQGSSTNSNVVRGNSPSKSMKSIANGKQHNLILKLFNREYSGNPYSTHGYMQPFIEAVPKGLSFCLKEVVPSRSLLGHVFMGLSSCGQFLFSYEIRANDNVFMPIFSLTTTYKYRLFFWIYQPHKKIRLYHHCCLFDDHSVDNLKDVTLIQWRCSDPRVLVIHGAARDRNEDSYITYVKVPKLGCRDCKKLRDADNDEFLLHASTLCFNCSLTVHTKYSRSDSDIKFDPYIQMICPERILLVSNGFLHMLHIHIKQAPSAVTNTTHTNQQQQQHQPQTALETSQMINSSNRHHDYYYGGDDVVSISAAGSSSIGPLLIRNSYRNVETDAAPTAASMQHYAADHCDNDNNIIARIIEDFTDIESTESINQHSGCATNTSASTNRDSSDYNYSNSNKKSVYSNTQLSRPSILKRSSSDELIENCHKNNNKKQNCNTSRNDGSGYDGTVNKVTSIVPPVSTSLIAVSSAATATPMITSPAPINRQRHRIVTKTFRRRGIYTYFSNTISTNNKGNNNGDAVTSPSAAACTSNNNNNNVNDTTTTATISGSNCNNNNSSSSSISSSSNDKASAYEFHEDNEKCEKISILRKKRLADRKYEFSDDNSENIKPFTIKRSTSTFLSPANSSCSSSVGTVNGLINIAVNNSNATNHHPQSPRSGFTCNFHGNTSPFNSPSNSPHSNVTRYRTTTPTTPVAVVTPASTQFSPNSFGGCSPLSFRSPPPSSSSSSINSNNNNNNLMLATVNNNCSSSSSSPISVRSPNRHLIANHIYNNNNNNSNNNNNCHTSCSAAAQYMLSFKTIAPSATTNTMLSPLHLSTMTKRSFDGAATTGSVSPTTFLSSPRRDGCSSGNVGEWRTVEVPIQGAAMTEKPLCTKKFQRRFVEEDDAASVITSEGDDCISPGYHTLLPLEVHGSCYSEMQMISRASYQRLHCTSVLIDQHTFDLEMFTYYVIATLCQKHEESFDYIIDWAYEIIHVCPVSSTVFCILIAHFECRHKNNSPHWHSFIKMMRVMPSMATLNRRQYECRVLFSWNMVTGEWEILDLGELYETDVTIDNVNGDGSGNDYYLSLRAKRLANDMSQSLKNILPDYSRNIRVLDSNIKKSKDSITDLDNLIEFRLRRAP